MHSHQVLLLIDDCNSDALNLQRATDDLEFEFCHATNLRDAIQLTSRKKPHIIFINFKLIDGENEESGCSFIDKIRSLFSTTLMIGYSDFPCNLLLNRAFESKLHHFISPRPMAGKDLENLIKFVRQQNLQIKSDSQPQDTSFMHAHGILINTAIETFIDTVSSSANLASVIYGETGTGKEEIAKLIHQKRIQKLGSIPFVPVNCATLNNDLVDSLLFGHCKGAFSGANHSTDGFIGQANGGILFLDEIHCLSLLTQQKLLRVLNDGSYCRVGDHTERRASFQVIAASTFDLDDAVDQHTFSLDLRNRISGLDLHLPPLRQRLDDLPTLISYYFTKWSAIVTDDQLAKIIKKCASFYWRGNIRQLYKCLETMVAQAHAENRPISLDMLRPSKLLFAPITTPSNSDQPTTKPQTAKVALTRTRKSAKDSQLNEVQKSLRRALSDCSKVFKELLTDGGNLAASMALIEKTILSHYIESDSSPADACRQLQLKRSTFLSKCKKFQLPTS